MERLTTTSDKGGVAFTFDLEVEATPQEMVKILRLAEKLKLFRAKLEIGCIGMMRTMMGTKDFALSSTMRTKKYKLLELTKTVTFLQ